MKKFLLITLLAVYTLNGWAQQMLVSPVSAQSQVTPPAQMPPRVEGIAQVQGQRQVTEQSPNINRTPYLTNLTGKTIQAYPNPATDRVLIQHVATTGRATITLISTNGQIIQEKSVAPNTFETEINVSRLIKGIYIVKFDDGRGDVKIVKLVKN
jgi:hypothetical protein